MLNVPSSFSVPAEPKVEPKPPAVVVFAPNKTVVVVVGPVDIRLPDTMPANPEGEEGEQIQPPLLTETEADDDDDNDADDDDDALLPLKPPFPFPLNALLPDGVVGVVPPLLREGFVVVDKAPIPLPILPLVPWDEPMLEFKPDVEPFRPATFVQSHVNVLLV